MAQTLMAELEALQSRCDRLSTWREERTEEAEKTISRLREVRENRDNGILITQKKTVFASNVLEFRVGNGNASKRSRKAGVTG